MATALDEWIDFFDAGETILGAFREPEVNHRRNTTNPRVNSPIVLYHRKRPRARHYNCNFSLSIYAASSLYPQQTNFPIYKRASEQFIISSYMSLMFRVSVRVELNLMSGLIVNAWID